MFSEAFLSYGAFVLVFAHRNLFKIVTAQLQQCLLALSFSLDWPEILKTFANTMRGLITFDLGNLVPLSCMSLFGSQNSQTATVAAYFQIFGVLFLIVGLVVFQKWNHYRWRTKNDSRAGERAVHVTHSSWTLYTLYGANLVNVAMKGAFYDDENGIASVVLFGSVMT